MSAPAHREVTWANKISNVADFKDEDHRPRILHVLTILGFRTDEEKARLLKMTPNAFKSTFAKNGTFTGGVLANLCQQLALKPGTFLGRRHFDKNESPVRNGDSWKGPLPCFADGDIELGVAIKTIMDTYPLDHSLEFKGSKAKALDQIAEGKYPIPTDLVARLAGENGKIKNLSTITKKELKALDLIIECDKSIPAGVKTIRQVSLPPLVSDVDPELRKALEAKYNTSGKEPATKQEETVKPPSQAVVSEISKPKQEAEMPDVYQQMYKDGKIGKHVAALARKLEKKKASVFFEGKEAGDKEINQVESGLIKVSCNDIELILSAADHLDLFSTNEFIFLDEFIREVKQAEKGASTTPAPEPQTEKASEASEPELAEEASKSDDETLLTALQAVNLDADLFQPRVPEARTALAARLKAVAARGEFSPNDIGKIVGRSSSFVHNLGGGSGLVDVDMIGLLCSEFKLPPGFFLRTEVLTDHEFDLAERLSFDPVAFDEAVSELRSIEEADEGLAEEVDPEPASAEKEGVEDETSPEEVGEDVDDSDEDPSLAASESEPEENTFDNDEEQPDSEEIDSEEEKDPVSVNGTEVQMSETEESHDFVPEPDETEAPSVQDFHPIQSPEMNGSAVVPVEVAAELVGVITTVTDKDLALQHAAEKLGPVCDEAGLGDLLEMVLKFANDEDVNPEEYVSGLRELHVAKLVMEKLRDAVSPENYQSFVDTL